ncbi:MAG: Uma2 family endonuclease [Isosphaeraceae bacterium]
MSTVTRRLSVDQYEQMVKYGILPETNRLELVEGRILEKEMKDPEHSTVVEMTREAIARVLPRGWITRQEQPVRIPNRKSEPEPDISVVRGSLRDYAKRHPDPGDVALVVEVTRSTVAKDRALARTYGGGGIPAYWIVNVEKQRLEVYEGPTDGKYPAPRILGKEDSVPLLIDGRDVGPIAVASLFP